MTEDVVAVDATLLLWIERNERPRREGLHALGILNALAWRFSKSLSGRAKGYATDQDVTHAVGTYDDDRLLKSLRRSPLGTLHGRIENASGTASWSDGGLTLDAARHPVPHTVVASCTGRRLRETVDAEWLHPEAIVTETWRTSVTTRLACRNWVVPLDRARLILTHGWAKATAEGEDA